MAVMLERWNDDKMDALDGKVDVLGTKVAVLDAKVDRLEVDVEKLDGKLDEHRKEMKAGFDKLSDRLMYALLAVIGAGATIAGSVLVAPHL
jgi:predicted RNase H-like nuclease (RuvC/YqgF family)